MPINLTKRNAGLSIGLSGGYWPDAIPPTMSGESLPVIPHGNTDSWFNVGPWMQFTTPSVPCIVMGYTAMRIKVDNVTKAEGTTGHRGKVLARLSFDDLVYPPIVSGGDYTTLMYEVNYDDTPEIIEYHKGVTFNVEWPVNNTGFGLLPNTTYQVFWQIKKVDDLGDVDAFGFDVTVESALLTKLTVDSITASV